MLTDNNELNMNIPDLDPGLSRGSRDVIAACAHSRCGHGRKNFMYTLSMTLLRGHHLVCLHFFHGDGYDDAFTENLGTVLARAEDEDIHITSGADDVCTSCPHLREGRCQYTENADASIREMDNMALALLNLSASGRAGWASLRDAVRGIFPQWQSLYCSECDWRGACGQTRRQ